MNKQREEETREAIRANRILLASNMGVVQSAKALKLLEKRLERAGLKREPFTLIECLHKWSTQDEAFGYTYCLACGEPDMVRMAEDAMRKLCE